MTLDPPGLLVEVQGEGHTHKADCREHNQDNTLAVRSEKDEALAHAAMALGWSVLWLYPRAEYGRSARWTAALEEAVAHVAAQKPPKTFSC